MAQDSEDQSSLMLHSVDRLRNISCQLLRQLQSNVSLERASFFRSMCIGREGSLEGDLPFVHLLSVEPSSVSEVSEAMANLPSVGVLPGRSLHSNACVTDNKWQESQARVTRDSHRLPGLGQYWVICQR